MEHVLIPSSKGFTLTLTHFPSPPSAPLLPAVIIAPATGVAASFYVSYASHLQSLGAAVTIVDYRYSGLSFPEGAESKEERREALIRATDVNIGTDWAGDMDSALGWVVGKYRERGIVAVCHSVGGE
jgi:predicted alpha/beta hydrolase